jgi:hypothetical protein
MIVSALLGFIITYINSIKLSLVVVGFLSILSLSTLIAPIGHSLGEMMLMNKNVTYNDSKYTYTGDVYYNGRTKITFYDYELKKIILLNKKDLMK